MIRVSCLLTVLCAFSLVSACTGPNRVEESYGTSVNVTKFHQMLNPDADKNLEPVTGMDGKAAQASIETYRKGFEKPAEVPQYIFNMGGNGK
jgi:hypothetical protein